MEELALQTVVMGFMERLLASQTGSQVASTAVGFMQAAKIARDLEEPDLQAALLRNARISLGLIDAGDVLK